MTERRGTEAHGPCREFLLTSGKSCGILETLHLRRYVCVSTGSRMKTIWCTSMGPRSWRSWSGRCTSGAGGGRQRAAEASHTGGLHHQGAWPHQRPSVRAGSGLRGAYPDGGEHFLLHGRNAGVLRHLLAGCAGSGGINGHTKRPPGCLCKTSRRSFFTASPVAAPAARRRRTFRLSAPVGTRRGTSQRCCGRRPSPAPVRRAWWRGIRRWCGALRR